MAKSLGEEGHLTFVEEYDYLVLEKCGGNKGIGIGNEFLKIAPRMEFLMGSGDKLYLISWTIDKSLL